jgi:hypothetical protein
MEDLGEPVVMRRAVILSVMVKQLDLTIVYEPGEDGWIISIPKVAGVFSQGRTREEARAN